ncbi:MAG: helix-turn-helix transcriptional regulator [Oscillospiraceae bacterium]
MDLDEAIKRVRSDMGLSQEALARELHVGFTSVNRWENGHTKPNQIARHALIKLCKENNIEPGLIETIEKIR